MPSQNRKMGAFIKRFTLIELLIAIAIIAILAGMLLPTLNAARQKAISINCLSNLKQIGYIQQSYANDYKEFLYCGMENLAYFWQWRYLECGYEMSGLKLDPTKTGSGRYKIVNKRSRIDFCPALESNSIDCGYGYPNAGAARPYSKMKKRFQVVSEAGYKHYYLPLSMIKLATRTWLMMDSFNTVQKKQKSSGMTFDVSSATNPLPHLRHSNACGVVFADGHSALLNHTEFRKNLGDLRRSEHDTSSDSFCVLMQNEVRVLLYSF
ncbi:MAG: type II secretion system protein [Victivallales bacterium]